MSKPWRVESFESFETTMNIKKVFFPNVENHKQLQKEKSNLCAAYNSNNIKDGEIYNAYLLKLNPKYLIIDIDGKNAYKYVTKLIKQHNINDIFLTHSISNKLKVPNNETNDYKYKVHVYFNNNLKITNKIITMKDLEIFTDKLIFEHKDELDDVDLNNLPDIPQHFFEDLLKYKLNKIEVNGALRAESTVIIDIPQGPHKINKNINENSNDINENNNNNEICLITIIIIIIIMRRINILIY